MLPGDARVVEDDVVVRTTPDEARCIEGETSPDEVAVDRDQIDVRHDLTLAGGAELVQCVLDGGTDVE